MADAFVGVRQFRSVCANRSWCGFEG